MTMLGHRLSHVISQHVCFTSYVILPLFSVFFVTAVFNGKRVRGLPINIISNSGATASHRVVHVARTIPAFHVAQRCTSRTRTETSIRQGDVCKCLDVPSNFRTGIVSNGRATLACCCRCTLVDIKDRVRKTFRDLLGDVSMIPVIARTITLNVGRRRVRSFLLPIAARGRPLFGPSVSCSICLARPFFFIFLRIVLLLIAACSVNDRKGFRASTG